MNPPYRNSCRSLLLDFVGRASFPSLFVSLGRWWQLWHSSVIGVFYHWELRTVMTFSCCLLSPLVRIEKNHDILLSLLSVKTIAESWEKPWHSPVIAIFYYHLWELRKALIFPCDCYLLSPSHKENHHILPSLLPVVSIREQMSHNWAQNSNNKNQFLSAVAFTMSVDSIFIYVSFCIWTLLT